MNKMDFEALLPDCVGDYLAGFTRMDYLAAFERYKVRIHRFVSELDRCGDISPVAESAVLYSERRIKAPWKKRKLCDMEYFLMLYACPALSDTSDAGEKLAKEINVLWNSRHPEAAFRIGSYQELSEGFRDTVFGFPITSRREK